MSDSINRITKVTIGRKITNSDIDHPVSLSGASAPEYCDLFSTAALAGTFILQVGSSSKINFVGGTDRLLQVS